MKVLHIKWINFSFQKIQISDYYLDSWMNFYVDTKGRSHKMARHLIFYLISCIYSSTPTASSPIFVVSSEVGFGLYLVRCGFRSSTQKNLSKHLTSEPCLRFSPTPVSFRPSLELRPGVQSLSPKGFPLPGDRCPSGPLPSGPAPKPLVPPLSLNVTHLLRRANRSNSLDKIRFLHHIGVRSKLGMLRSRIRIEASNTGKYRCLMTVVISDLANYN